MSGVGSGKDHSPDQPGMALALRPQCSHEGHGFMELRPTGLSRDADWCGRWYDCTRCSSSVLLHGPELLGQLAEQEAALVAREATPTLFDGES